jgi:NADH dehydrogenase
MEVAVRIFITGGTGFVGGHIIDTLLADDHEVIVQVRSEESAGKIITKGASTVRCSLSDKGALESALENIDAVIHLVGIIVETRGEGTFNHVHYEITKNVVDAVKAAGIRKYVHMSALGASVDAESEYHRTKGKAEEYVKESGLDFTIFKPSVIHGGGDAFVNMYAKMFKISPFVPVIGDGKVKMQPVYVKDIARLFKMAVSDAKFNGGIYEVGGPEQLTFDEIVNTISRVMGKRAFNIHLPMWLMKINAALMRPVFKKPPISKDQLIMLNSDNICDESKVKEDFAIDLGKFEDSIKEYIL